MSDISRAGVSDIVLKDNFLKKQWVAIQISEKENQIKQLGVTLDKLHNVELKRILHAMERCKREIAELKTEYENIIIDVKATKKKGG